MSKEEPKKIQVTPQEALMQAQADLLIITDNAQRQIEKCRRMSQMLGGLQTAMEGPIPKTRKQVTRETMEEAERDALEAEEKRLAKKTSSDDAVTPAKK